jgi:putative ABC transport system ATP-binding protein
MSESVLLSIKNVSKHYGRGETLVKAVEAVSLEVYRGDILLIKGPSGSGKTTLLTMIGLLLKPTTGTILYNGDDVTHLGKSEQADFRLKKIGFIFQSFNLIPSLNAYENVAIAASLNKINKTGMSKKATKLFALLGIESRIKHLPEELSGGERQRVAIARALVNSPEIILADEPTANLDSKSGEAVIEMLCQIACQQDKAVIIVSHDDRISRSVKRIITMEDGMLSTVAKGGHDQTCKHQHKTPRSIAK